MKELVLGGFSWTYDPTADYKWTRWAIGVEKKIHPRNLVFSIPHIDGRSLTPDELRTIADFIEQQTGA